MEHTHEWRLPRWAYFDLDRLKETGELIAMECACGKKAELPTADLITFE